MPFKKLSHNLFANHRYTFDTCSFNAVLQPLRAYSRDRFQSLWREIEKAIVYGVIVSHVEVYKEILQAKEFKDELAWVRKNKGIFADYDLAREPGIISDLGSLFPTFIHQYKKQARNADPWLVAQAKANKLTIVTEETGKDTQIPVVCSKIGVACVNIRQVIEREKWVI